MAATRAAVCIAAFADNARIAFALPPRAMAGSDANATVGCAAIAPSAEPSQPPRPANAAPLQYPANEGRDPSTFTPPATVFAKLGVSERTTPLHLKSCKLERWFQRSSARTLELVVIAPRRMVYEIVTTFDHYEGHGGAWGPGFRTFIVDAVTGQPHHYDHRRPQDQDESSSWATRSGRSHQGCADTLLHVTRHTVAHVIGATLRSVLLGPIDTGQISSLKRRKPPTCSCSTDVQRRSLHFHR